MTNCLAACLELLARSCAAAGTRMRAGLAVLRGAWKCCNSGIDSGAPPVCPRPPGPTPAAGLPPELMQEGVDWALDQRAQGRAVLTYCTHGHSRSAIMVCAQLVAAGHVKNIEEARDKVKEVRSGIHPNKRQWAALERWFEQYHGRGAAPEPNSNAGVNTDGGAKVAEQV